MEDLLRLVDQLHLFLGVAVGTFLFLYVFAVDNLRTT
jgi:hypothetical protein